MANSFKELLGDAYKDDISVEELEKLIIPVITSLQDDNAKTKKNFDSVSSDLANAKKELTNHQTQEEKEKAESQAQWDALVKENNELKRELNVSKFEKNYIAEGYDETSAHETAEALADQNFEKVFSNQRKFLTAQKKKLEATNIDKTPKIEGGDAEQPNEQKNFKDLTYDEREKLYNTNRPEYDKQSNGK